MVRTIVVLILLALLPSVAHADKRLALLIGNEAYAPAIGALANPHNDVSLLEQALKGLGFEVAVERDAGLGALTRAVNAYARRLQAAGQNAVGFFYYSGHGASDGSTNYLIPIDVKTTEAGELWDQSLRLTEITRKLKTEAGNATHFVVFDACRNTLKLTQPGSRAVVQSKGFVPVVQENGMLIAYATAEGELASDVGTAAGPYAKTLAEEIVKPGIEAVVMFRAVQRRVRAAIRQEPYLGFNALGDIYLAGKGEQSTAAAPTPQRVSDAAEAWDRTKDTTNIAVLGAFATRFKDTFLAELARARIEELKRQQASETVRQGVAIQQKIEDERNRAEELKKKEQVAIAVPPAIQAPARSAANCDGIDITTGPHARHCLKPGAGNVEHFGDCPTCPEMVVVPAGTFTMGSPTHEPERESVNKGSEDQLSATIAKPFAVGRFALTRGEFAAFVAATGHKTDGGCWAYTGTDWNLQADRNWRSPGFTQNDRHPVVCVNWDDANAYATWLSKKTGKAYRLPSEAEREYAARAGTTTPFWWGSTISTTQANYNGNYTYSGGSKGEWRKATMPVDSFAPNPWGLYNVHGNVWDWTEDCWNASNAGNPGNGDPRSTGDCRLRVHRGGSWGKVPQLVRSANRAWLPPGYRFDDVGLRLARTLDP
jgi:formylglycine-generating enzyme required for sulfatase activity